MASAFSDAIKAGRGAFLAGPMIAQEFAVASTPEIGRPFSVDSSPGPCSYGRTVSPCNTVRSECGAEQSGDEDLNQRGTPMDRPDVALKMLDYFQDRLSTRH
jgi:hypothetical protein